VCSFRLASTRIDGADAESKYDPYLGAQQANPHNLQQPAQPRHPCQKRYVMRWRDQQTFWLQEDHELPNCHRHISIKDDYAAN
jgi:hypothetical protein